MATINYNGMELEEFAPQDSCFFDPPKPRRATNRELPMPKDDYPLHPGQTHAEPYYCTIPLEEYESMKKRIAELEKLQLETMDISRETPTEEGA